jgi:hypothetical protein
MSLHKNGTKYPSLCSVCRLVGVKTTCPFYDRSFFMSTTAFLSSLSRVQSYNRLEIGEKGQEALTKSAHSKIMNLFRNKSREFVPLKPIVRHVTGNDQDYLRKIPRVVVQKSALL